MKYIKLFLYALFIYGLLNLTTYKHKMVRSFVASKTVTLTYTDTKKFGGGTGVHVKLPHGGNAILTNAHVCALKDEHNEILVTSPLLEHPMNRRVIGVANFTDLCLIEGVPGISGLSLGSNPEPGDEVNVIGHPFLMPTTLTHGEVIGEGEVDVADYIIYNEQDEANCNAPKNKVLTIDTFFGMMKVCVVHINALHTNAIIYPGNSGSAVVNEDGRMVGLAFAGSTETHWGLVVTLEDISHFLYQY